MSGASETGASLRHNREDFADYAFRPRVLRDVSQRSTRTTILGESYSAPFGIAPMGISALMAYQGDLVLAQGASQAGIPMIMSGSSLIRLEEVVAKAPATWFQAYLPGEPERIDALVDRVAEAGFKTSVLTVDTSALANRENNIRAGFARTGKLMPVNQMNYGLPVRVLSRASDYENLPHQPMPSGSCRTKSRSAS